MILPLERWLSDADLPEEANVAFSEAVRCYKAGASRAALLFSYLGWGLALRRRILLAQCPPGIKPKQWTDIGEKLRKEDRWESQVFDCSQMTQPATIFDVSEDLRFQVRFWRDRRNDCAHFKANDIGESHVEAFWQFVRSNLAKFVPRGTRAALIEEIKKFFDANRTPPGSNIRPLVDLIPVSIEPGQATSFFQTIVDEFSFSPELRSAREPVLLFEGILAANSARIVKDLGEYLANETWLLLPLLRSNPSRVLNWHANREVIRRIWRELLFSDGRQDLAVYVALIRNDLIPAGEIEESNSWIVGKLNGDIPGSQELEFLRAADFFTCFARYAFDERKVDEFDWGNRNAQTIRWYVETFPITPKTATVLCSVFWGPPFPFEVRDALGSLFEANSEKRRELESVASEAGLEVPKSILTAAKSDV